MKLATAVFLSLVVGIVLSGRASPLDPLKRLGAPKNADVPSCQLQDLLHYVPAGYPVEIHKVITDDGFILQVFRIQKKGTEMRSGLPTLFVQHGFMGSGLVSFFNREDSEAFIFANEGFDVWIGNSRGTRFSREHKKYTQDQKEFWAWSFQEMGQYDIPAVIAKIRKESGMDKITYIGHSQGTSQMFAALADRDTRDKIAPYIDTFHALTPVVLLSSTEMTELKLAKVMYWAMEPINGIFHMEHSELGGCGFDEAKITKYQQECNQNQCNFFNATDPIKETINYQNYGYVMNASPAGYATRCQVHYAQFIKMRFNHEKFQKFDHGSYAKNKAAYGQSTPPEYPLKEITNRIILYLGEKDRLAALKDTSRVAGLLSGADVTVRLIPEWGHKAFIMAKKGREFYTPMVLDIYQRHQRLAKK